MELGIEKLESTSDEEDINIEQLLNEYRQLYTGQPVWRLVQDIQRQTMIYTNIIEQLKEGKSAATIRLQLEGLELVPSGTLPNPDVPELLNKAFMKIGRYRRAMVEIVKRFGGEMLQELSFEVGLTVSVGVDLGFPPAMTIAVEHTATAQTAIQWSNRTAPVREP
ncbi:MAG TPA: hypothetical protein VFY26_06165 [Anaerolineales bacterium]|nr:hypothetical protein [Anaerolineales bacterium]